VEGVRDGHDVVAVAAVPEQIADGSVPERGEDEAGDDEEGGDDDERVASALGRWKSVSRARERSRS
jgi:hypothetical protein